MTSPTKSYQMKCAWLRAGERRDREGTVIEMRLTFEQWAQVWMDSGHWGEWGNRGKKYVMSRVDNLGHYKLGNVFIQTIGANTAEANRRRVGILNPGFGKPGTGPTTKAGRKVCSDIGTATSQYEYTCPHCSKEGRGPSMFKWHFDRCKHKGE